MMSRKLLIFCMLCMIIVATANASLINLENNFTSDPAPSVIFTNAGYSATISEAPNLGVVMLFNDPGLGNPEVIVPGLLSFSYNFVEGAGDEDEFGAFVFDIATGAPTIPAFEFYKQNSGSGSVLFDLSPLAGKGKTLGLQFQLSSLPNDDDDYNSIVEISNVQLQESTAIPEPSTILMMVNGFGALFMVTYSRFRKKN